MRVMTARQGADCIGNRSWMKEKLCLTMILKLALWRKVISFRECLTLARAIRTEVGIRKLFRNFRKPTRDGFAEFATKLLARQTILSLARQKSERFERAYWQMVTEIDTFRLDSQDEFIALAKLPYALRAGLFKRRYDLNAERWRWGQNTRIFKDLIRRGLIVKLATKAGRR